MVFLNTCSRTAPVLNALQNVLRRAIWPKWPRLRCKLSPESAAAWRSQSPLAQTLCSRHARSACLDCAETGIVQTRPPLLECLLPALATLSRLTFRRSRAHRDQRSADIFVTGLPILALHFFSGASLDRGGRSVSATWPDGNLTCPSCAAVSGRTPAQAPQ